MKISGQVGHTAHIGFVMPWRRTVIRGPPLLDIKEATLLPGTNRGNLTLFGSVALRTSGFYFFVLYSV